MSLVYGDSCTSWERKLKTLYSEFLIMQKLFKDIGKELSNIWVTKKEGSQITFVEELF